MGGDNRNRFEVVSMEDFIQLMAHIRHAWIYHHTLTARVGG
jgi:hypothetical protein